MPSPRFLHPFPPEAGPEDPPLSADLVAFDALARETIRTFHRFKYVTEELHGQGEPSAGRRGVLLDLEANGLQTVPDMARKRPVSRQYIQSLCNGLADDGYVEFRDNPAHKRSRLVAITDAGRALLEDMRAREAALFGAVQLDATPEEMERAAAVLRRVRRAFEGRAWRELVEATLAAPRT